MASRASGPRRSGHTKQFGKDWKRLARSGRYPMEELRDVMRLLIDLLGFGLAQVVGRQVFQRVSRIPLEAVARKRMQTVGAAQASG